MTDLDPLCMQKFTKKVCPTTEQMLKVSVHHISVKFCSYHILSINICTALHVYIVAVCNYILSLCMYGLGLRLIVRSFVQFH